MPSQSKSGINCIDGLERQGFAIVDNVIDAETIARLIDELEHIGCGDAVRRRGETAFGIRDLLNKLPAVKNLADSSSLRILVEPVLGREAKAVKGVFFDKTPEVNWKVAWHQDLTIAVRKKVEAEGFSSWSVKAGVTHVQPPPAVLERVLTLRLHLDDADERNGALRVIPGSHRHGRLDHEEIQKWKEKRNSVTCAVPKGGVLLMRPLLLHSSTTSTGSAHRRVVHLEFSATNLPPGLEWYGS